MCHVGSSTWGCLTFSSTDEVPLISLPALVLMKLDAFRPHDRDVRTLIQIHRNRLREVRDHLVTNAPELVHRLGEVLAGR